MLNEVNKWMNPILAVIESLVYVNKKIAENLDFVENIYFIRAWNYSLYYIFRIRGSTVQVFKFTGISNFILEKSCSEKFLNLPS